MIKHQKNALSSCYRIDKFIKKDRFIKRFIKKLKNIEKLRKKLAATEISLIAIK